MKKYFQNGHRDSDGDILIEQYSEETLPSGIILPNMVGRIEIISQVSLEYMIQQMSDEFYHEPNFQRYGFTLDSELTPRQCFSVTPSEPLAFCKLSVLAIVSAFSALTYRDVPPRISLTGVQEIDVMLEDDKQTFNSIAQAVYNSVHNIDVPATEDVPMGQYL